MNMQKRYNYLGETSPHPYHANFPIGAMKQIWSGSSTLIRFSHRQKTLVKRDEECSNEEEPSQESHRLHVAKTLCGNCKEGVASKMARDECYGTYCEKQEWLQKCYGLSLFRLTFLDKERCG